MAGLTAAGATALGAGLSAAATLGSAAATQGMTARARKENYEYNELAAKNAFNRQIWMQEYLQSLQYKQFYDLESPSAIMKQLKEAGLSPSMYANGALGNSISGVSTPGSAPQGAGASGLQPAFTPINLAQAAADNALKVASANREQAEADRINGNNQRGKAEIENLITDKLGKEAEINYTKMRTLHEEILKDIDNASSESQINEIFYKAEIAAKNAEKLTYSILKEYGEANITLETMQAKIDREELINKEINSRTLLNKAHLNLSNAQIEQISAQMDTWANEIEQGYLRLANEFQRTQSYDDYVKNLNEFQDNQIKNFERKLDIDIDQFNRRQKLAWTQTIMSFWNAQTDRFANMLTSMIPK